MYIETKRLTVKPISENYKAEMLALFYDDEIKQTYMLPDFENTREAEKLFCTFVRLSNSPDRVVGGIFCDRKLIGFINDVGVEAGSIELGYVISPEYKNQGYCTEALSAVIDYLFKTGFEAVICGAFEENAASIRVMQKCKMRLLDKVEEIYYREKNHRCVYYSITKK